MTRRGFLTNAALLAASIRARVSTPDTVQRPITLQYFRGIDMEHRVTLAATADLRELERIAEAHAGASLEWAVGEIEGCIAFAMHPSDVGEYLLLEPESLKPPV